MGLSYSDYLKIPDLLHLQDLRSKPQEHDELLFIIIHQSYELWFRQLLHESQALIDQLEQGNTWAAAKTLRRKLKIWKTLVGQIDILETMTPLSFKSFRSFLDTASGFQSVQFRLIEIRCGFVSPMLPTITKRNPDLHRELEEAQQQSTLWEALLAHHRFHGIKIPEPTRQNQEGFLFQPDLHIREALIGIEQNHPKLAMLNEFFIDLDEGIMEWRYRHLKLVQRTIGFKQGTGGSTGFAHLQKTLARHFFEDLWLIRSEL